MENKRTKIRSLLEEMTSVFRGDLFDVTPRQHPNSFYKANLKIDEAWRRAAFVVLSRSQKELKEKHERQLEQANG
jgi:hypothetical protein